MSINEILKTGANVQLVINALDLREAFLQWNEEFKQAKPAETKEETQKAIQRIRRSDGCRRKIPKKLRLLWSKICMRKPPKCVPSLALPLRK